jgi:hypothetical protein
MISTIVAGSYTGTEGYLLVGLITSGIGAELAEGPRGGMLHVLDETTGLIRFETTPKDAIMLQILMQNLTDHEMVFLTFRVLERLFTKLVFPT